MFSRYLRFRPEGGDVGAAAAAAPAATEGAAAATIPVAGATEGAPAATAGDAGAAAAGAAAAPVADPAKPAAAAAATADAVVYDLKLPANPSLDPASIERTVAIARERGLSNDAAQAALELANTEVAAAVTAYQAAHQPGGAEWVKQEAAWRDAALADPEIGAGKPELFAARVAVAEKAFTKFASPAFIEMMTKSGFASHPEVVRVFAKIGEAMGEGALAINGASPTLTAGRAEDRMYPTMTPPS